MFFLKFKKPDKKTLWAVIACWLFLPLLFVIFRMGGIIFTYSGSVPVGFYHVTHPFHPIQIGDYVSFCLPDAKAEMGLSRGYLTRGDCPNGSDELLKKVIAVPGDRVIVTDDRLQVKRQGEDFIFTYMAPTTAKDKNGEQVYRFIQNGEYTARGYWVYGFADARYSWDSRYFGEIAPSNIKGRLTPLLLF